MSEPRWQLAETTTSLAQWLAPLAFNGTANEVTTLLTAEVIGWAEQRRLNCTREVPSKRTRTSQRGFKWQGRLDLIATHPDGARIAIEIDRGNKQWSIAKLAAEADTNTIAIWVKWFERTSLLVPRTIGLIELRSRRIAVPGQGFRYRRTPYLTWPGPPQHSPVSPGLPTQLRLDSPTP